jgi:DNA-directed RNA polymerase specialized sigma24 family protein
MKNFKPTPIPHRSKSGNPMAYYMLSEDGVQTKVSRSVCLAPAEKPDSQYQQRWYVDEESGLVVRLPRNAEGEALARANMRDIWREQKYQERKRQCIYKNTTACDGWEVAKDGTQKCDGCGRKHTSRIVEMDRLVGLDNEAIDSVSILEPADDLDIASVMEDNALLSTLYAALAELTQEDRDLITEIFWNDKTERELAPQLGFKQSKSVNKRKHRILEILRQNESLRSFFG